MNSDEIVNAQNSSSNSDFFPLECREYLPKEKCTVATWNDNIRVGLQYEFTNLLSVFALSKDENIAKESQNKLQRIVFEILLGVLHHEDINSTLAIEFLENCSILSYLKICKLLGYDFPGKDDLDTSEISIIEIKNKSKDLLFNSKENSNENLPPFSNYIEKFITPFIMDGAWFIQMSYNENQGCYNSKWVEFMTRLCRGNITSKERPLPSIPRSVKLINIKDIVLYLDLGKTDSMGITDSLISQNFRLQQKYVRERTRICFTVDSFVTQRECLKGFSILAILIKIYFEQSIYSPNIDDFLDINNEPNLHVDSLSKCKNFNNIELNIPNNRLKIDSIWNVILRYDLSIQRSIGIIFEVFISFCSSLCDLNKNSFEFFNNKLFSSLKSILNIFPKKMVSKTYLIFIEYFPNVYDLLIKSSTKNDYRTNINIGNDKYCYVPWLINNQNEIGDVINLSFFILSSILIKMDYINFSSHFKQKLIKWDELFWSWNDLKSKESEEVCQEMQKNKGIISEFIPLVTITHIKEAYQYYHLVFNAQLNNEKLVETNSYIESIFKEILKLEGVSNYEMNFSDIFVILSDFMNLPSILFANAYFICNFQEDQKTEGSIFNYHKQLSVNFEVLKEITDKTFLPICVFKTSSLIIKERLNKELLKLKIHIDDYKYCLEKYISIYNEFCSLMDWVKKYCGYYLFMNYPEIIPLVFDVIITFMEINNNRTFDLTDKSNHLTSFQKAPTDLLFDISTNLLFPAISFLPRTPLIPEILKNSLFDRLGLNCRYRIYRKLIVDSYNKYPMNYQWVSIKKSLSKHLKGVTRDIITSRSDTKNSSDSLKIPPTQIRLLVSNIINLTYTNPLVVCDVVINQCSIYDNMIPLLIEIMGENIDEITLDIMVFTIINFILSRESSNISSHLKSGDVKNSKFGPGGIARFVALLFSRRRVPKDVICNFINTIMYRIDEVFEGIESKVIIPSSISDIVFWKQFVEIVLSTPIIDISVLTKRQLRSLGGGPILFQYSFSHIGGNSLENNGECQSNNLIQDVNSNCKLTNNMVISMLKEGEIRIKEVLFRLTKLKSEILWNTSNDSINNLKFLVNLLDEIHWCCIQTIEFLRRSFNPETYRNSILEIKSEEDFFNIIYQTFIYLDIPTGWSFIRPGIRTHFIQIEDRNLESLDNNFLDVHPDALNCIKSYILDEHSDDSFLKDNFWIYFYVLFWYLDISDISVPREEYSKKLFELYSDIYSCREAIFKIVNPNSKDLNNSMKKYPLSSFSDPGKMVGLPNYSKQRNLNSRQVKDNVKAHEKKLKKLYNTYFLLSKEFNRISNRNKYIFNYLYSELGISRFKKEFETNILTSNYSENNVDSFMVWICKTLITPRVIQSENDAVFTFKWIETFLFSTNVGIFSSDRGLINSFLLTLCKLVSSIIRSSTPRESQLLGLFFNYVFSFCKELLIEDLNKSYEALDETETRNIERNDNNTNDELAEAEKNERLKNICNKLYSSNNDKHHLDFVIECERNVLVSLSFGLGLLIEKPLDIYPDWIDTLNSIWMLLRCYESFPISKFSGDYLLKILPKVLEYATKKQWNDLNLSINSLLLKLKQHKINWIGTQDEFESPSQKDNAPVEEKTHNSSPEKDVFSRSQIQVKYSENRAFSTPLGVNNTKKQRITPINNYRGSFSHSKQGTNRR
ncbi:giant membrane protein [Cryptosporidium ryanae]|uniref:giant membrane protein n=1 Tax=Cryptosporidium ryanae TaxID=515981 RepID=UPI00351A2846|nr:giant membrane protein [Cryptosporidium ryanae]